MNKDNYLRSVLNKAGLIWKNAFTLIELLVVVTIIMVITTSWTIYFFNFLDSRDVKQNIEKIKNNIYKLDFKVKNYEIFDYKIEFSSGSLGYMYYVNNFDIPYNQTIEFNTITWTGIIKTNTLLNWWIRVLKIYKKHKLYINRVLWSTDIYTWSFDSSSIYKITWTLSWKILNEINIKYFSQENTITLNTISKNINKTILCDNLLTITNIWWKKSILCWVTPWLSAYLFFTDNWIEDFIEIK